MVSYDFMYAHLFYIAIYFIFLMFILCAWRSLFCQSCLLVDRQLSLMAFVYVVTRKLFIERERFLVFLSSVTNSVVTPKTFTTSSRAKRDDREFSRW
jgi:DMSO/TMAO reductase YedYZ heme-binding membrane subunit